MSNLPESLQIALPLIVASLGGLAVGIEREWSARASGERTHFGGVRTFLLLGLLGGLSARLTQQVGGSAGIILLAAAVALVIIAYATSAMRGDRDGTTEIATLLVLAAGLFAGYGELALASAINAFTVLVLAEKTRLHNAVFTIQSEELLAGARFAVLALVILPLLPEGPFGPDPGIRPRELWVIVLIFSGLNFAGYAARRTAGAERGLLMTGILGGLISSTGVTLNFAQQSRIENSAGRALGYGALAASTILLIRVAVILSLFNRNLSMATIPYLAFPMAVGIVSLVLAFRNGKKENSGIHEEKSPLRFLAALKLTILFQAGLFLLHWVSARFGSNGVLVSAGVVGFTDMDTLIYIMVKLGSQPDQIPVAAQALAIGVVSNNVAKAAIALFVGKGEFRKIAALGLIAMILVGIAGLMFFVYQR